MLVMRTTDDPHSAAAPLDLAVVPSEPPPHLPGDVPAGVVPDEEQNLLADLFKLVQAPLKKLRRYGTDRPSVHESQPRLINLRQVETVTRDGFRLGVVFSDRPLNEAQGLGGGDPPLRPHPSDPEKTRKRRPDGLPRDPPFDKPLLKGNLGCHLKRPEARVPTKLPRRAVEHLPQCLGAPLVEGVAGALRARRLRDESIQTPLV